MTDQVTEEIAFAATNSRSETRDGIAAVFAGSKKVERPSCSTVKKVYEPQLISPANKKKTQHNDRPQQVGDDHD